MLDKVQQTIVDDTIRKTILDVNKAMQFHQQHAEYCTRQKGESIQRHLEAEVDLFNQENHSDLSSLIYRNIVEMLRHGSHDDLTCYGDYKYSYHLGVKDTCTKKNRVTFEVLIHTCTE